MNNEDGLDYDLSDLLRRKGLSQDLNLGLISKLIFFPLHPTVSLNQSQGHTLPWATDDSIPSADTVHSPSLWFLLKPRIINRLERLLHHESHMNQVEFQRRWRSTVLSANVSALNIMCIMLCSKGHVKWLKLDKLFFFEVYAREMLICPHPSPTKACGPWSECSDSPDYIVKLYYFISCIYSFCGKIHITQNLPL